MREMLPFDAAAVSRVAAVIVVALGTGLLVAMFLLMGLLRADRYGSDPGSLLLTLLFPLLFFGVPLAAAVGSLFGVPSLISAAYKARGLWVAVAVLPALLIASVLGVLLLLATFLTSSWTPAAVVVAFLVEASLTCGALLVIRNRTVRLALSVVVNLAMTKIGLLIVLAMWGIPAGGD